MKAAKLNYWNNKWSDVFDFTPSRNKNKNYAIKNEVLEDFVSPLSQMLKIVDQVEKRKGSKL